MPTSIDPQPKEDETECARCGAYFFYELTRCPECGVNIYEPDEENEYERNSSGEKYTQNNIYEKVKDFIQRVLGKPYSADDVFGDGLNQAILYNDILQKVSGDHTIVERLVEFEKKQKPGGNRMIWLQNAIERWNRDNRIEKKL